MHVSSWTSIGGRKYQEDRFFVGARFCGKEHLTLFVVCDGHGGAQASSFLIAHFPEKLSELVSQEYAKGKRPKSAKPTVGSLMVQALATCEEEWDRMCFQKAYGKLITKELRNEWFDMIDEQHYAKAGLTAGSTIIAMLLDTKKRRANILNLGDSRATWKVGSDEIRHSTDHNVPTKTVEKIENFEYKIEDGRLEGDLAMSRAFGDNCRDLTGVVKHNPDLYHFSFENSGFRAVLASDGFWDELTDQKALFEAFDDAKELAEVVGYQIITEKAEAIEAKAHEMTQAALAKATGVPAKEFDVTAWRKKFKPVFDDNTTLIYIKFPSPEEQTATRVQKGRTTDITHAKQKLDKLVAATSTLRLNHSTNEGLPTASIAAKSSSSSSSLQRRRPSSSRKSSRKKDPLPKPKPIPSRRDAETYSKQNVTVHFVRKNSTKKP